MRLRRDSWLVIATTTDTNAACAGPHLIAHYKLDEVSGRTIVDAIESRNGTWTDAGNDDVADDTMAGRSGQALSFGTGSSISIPTFVLPDEGTFTAWLTSTFDDTSSPAEHPMVMDTPSPRATISFAGDISSYGLRTNGISWQAAYAPPADLSGWFHLAATPRPVHRHENGTRSMVVRRDRRHPHLQRAVDQR